MGVDINLYRACIGMFNTYKFSKQKFSTFSIYYLLCLIMLLVRHFLKTTHFILSDIVTHRRSLNMTCFIFLSNFFLWHISTLICLSGDVEINPGPVTNYSQGFTICHWNLNSIPTDNFAKMPLLEAYALTYNFDIVCLSETFLDSSYLYDDPRLSLPGYSLIRADHPM